MLRAAELTHAQLLNSHVAMKLANVLVTVAATFLFGCTTTVDKATKSPDLTTTIPAVTVVFVGSMIEGGEARHSLGTALTTPYLPRSAPGLEDDAASLGKFALSALPAAIKEAGVQFSAQTRLLPKRPASREELNTALGPDAAGKPVLVIQPTSARMECPNSCFVFTLDAQLLPAGTSTAPLWTATMVAPPRASKFHDFASPGKSVAVALVQQLKADAVVK